MKLAPRVPRLRWMLPIAQLFLSAVVLSPLRPMLADQIQESLRSYGIVKDSTVNNPVGHGSHPFDLDLSNPVVQRRIKIAETREWAVAALNLPGGLPDVVYAIVSPAHAEWRPRGMLMWTWRDLSWPIICIFFWWLTGRSVEALLFSRHTIPSPKIRWWEVVVSPVLVFVILGTCTPLVCVVHWRLRNRLTLGTDTDGNGRIRTLVKSPFLVRRRRCSSFRCAPCRSDPACGYFIGQVIRFAKLQAK